MHDLRLAFRQLGKSPGFTTVAVLTLALGIGACTAIFSVIDAALLRPLKFTDAHQLVEFWTRLPSGREFGNITGPQFKHLRDHADGYSSVSLFRKISLNLIEGGKAERVNGLEVSSSYLNTLGVVPLLGSDFDAHADQPGGNGNVVLLSHGWWQTRYGGDRNVIGRTLTFNLDDYTIIGVLPVSASVRDNADFLLPVPLENPAESWRLSPSNPWASVVARMKPGVTLTQAQGITHATVAELEARIRPNEKVLTRVSVRALQDVLVAETRPMLLILLGAVALVLLIACANVANLLLVRATARQREMAVRSALGASTGRIVRQVLTESVVLSLCGGVAGAFLATLAVDLLARAIVNELPNMLHPVIDLRVLGFTLLLACGTGIFFGLLPAWRARRTDLVRDLKESSRGSSGGGRLRAQSILVIAEIALTCTLLLGSGLLLRSFGRLLQADVGFDPNHAVACDVSLTAARFPNVDAQHQFCREMVARIEALPGVETAGYSTTLPMSGESWGGPIRLTRDPENSRTGGCEVDYVGGNFFQAMRMTLVAGRFLNEADNRPDAEPVAVLDEGLAEHILPDEDPLGQSVRFSGQDYRIVGTIRAVRHHTVDQPVRRHAYFAHVFDPGAVRLIVRATTPPAQLNADIRRTMTELDPTQSVSNFRTLDEAVSRSLRERRVGLLLVGLFAAIALGLACLGIYGVMAFTVIQRQRELTIRLALGANRGDLVRLVLRDGLRLVAVGLSCGLLAGAALSRLLQSRLYEVSPLDPIVYLTVALLLSAVAVVAILIPARTATRFDWLSALRVE
jgi:predicted permease